ncbi:hypothetical protein [Frigoriglobus tundricola]|uniref:Uncharacterized protein n=1 Tax=Frigoriglobus tundricola TaxID=2774151 RepID=A0A6M5YZ83_9BACT|nr:hypothetical protein [Frigoriglobus tundricola]QJW98766.1 hypothetical protein FTUN_6361 [Frigoriglobus tundricola]
MKLLRSAIITVAALAIGTPNVFAGPPGCATCGDGGFGHGGFKSGGHTPPPPTSLFAGLQFHKQKLPVFQAAPWYNYWPYDGHFLTPAPVGGPFYGPPMTGNFPVNPYFPGPMGAAGYAPIPGGAAPGGR